MKASTFFYCFLFCVSALAIVPEHSLAQPQIDFQTVATGLSSPVDVVAAPGDGRLFIVQQGGLVRIWTGSGFITFLNVTSLLPSPSGNEQGLLSLAFHPQYATNRYFFIWYTAANGSVTLARYRRDAINADVADAASGQVLLSIAKPNGFTNHNGGKLNFGSDGYLYIGTGDGGSAGDPFNNAQNLTSLLGKMLRIDVNSFATSAPFYDIPPNNPYLSPGDNIRDEIWAFGLRNPWRWSFDRATGDMWIGDVGQDAWEEINYRPAGATSAVNYGWKCYEGAHVYSASCSPTDTVSPVFEYPHNNTTGGVSVTGGYVYRGAEFPALQGYYLTADFLTGNFWLVWPNGSGGFNSYLQPADLPTFITGFGEGSDGEVYAVRRSGTLYKIVVSSVLPVKLHRFDAVGRQGFNQVEWTTTLEVNTSAFVVQYSHDGRRFSDVATVSPKGVGTYEFKHNSPPAGNAWYRLAIKDVDGRIEYSSIVQVRNTASQRIEVFPTVITDGRLQVKLNKEASELNLLNGNGSVVFSKDIRGRNGLISLNLPALAAGIYILRVTTDGGIVTQKLMIE